MRIRWNPFARSEPVEEFDEGMIVEIPAIEGQIKAITPENTAMIQTEDGTIIHGVPLSILKKMANKGKNRVGFEKNYADFVSVDEQ